MSKPYFCPSCGAITSIMAPSACKSKHLHWAPHARSGGGAEDTEMRLPSGASGWPPTNLVIETLKTENKRLRAELAASAEALEMVDAAIKYWCDGSMSQIIQSDLLNRAAHCAAAAKRAREASKQ